MEIQRYDLVQDGLEQTLEPTPKGEWVRREAHAAALAEMQGKLDAERSLRESSEQENDRLRGERDALKATVERLSKPVDYADVSRYNEAFEDAPGDDPDEWRRIALEAFLAARTQGEQQEEASDVLPL